MSPSSGTGSGYDALSANWSLYPESPCVNAGTPDTTGLALPTTDLGDGARIQNDTIDMGAYETLRIPGCTNPAGLNYDPLANYDDGSCEFSGEDCGQAINYGTVNDPAISGLVLQNSDKWAYFTINVDYKSVTISLCGSNFDTEMELYEDCDSTNYFAFNDNFCGAKSQITLDTLVQGIYYVRILGVGLANGSFDLEITGTEILNTSLSATHVTCYGYSDGIVDMTISGGASPFTIEWSNGMTMEDLVDIVAGTYNVTVTDTESSTSINSMTITQPDAPTRDYDIRHVVCHGDSTGEIDLTIDGDFPPFTFEWPGGATSEDRTVLFAGTYDLTITDDDGCLINDDITVNQTDLIVPGFVKNNVSCHGDSDGDIDLSVSGGIPPFAFEWSFSFDTTFLETTEDLSLLAYGTYYLTITDDSACQVNNFAIIFEPDILALSITGTSVSIAGASDGIADLTVTGGTMPYSYLWSNDSTSQDINAIPEGAYTVTVTDDKACTETASVYISEPPVNITQSISLPQDWSIFSTYINPPEPGIDSVLNDIVSNVTIVKDEDGNVYWPFYTTDLIGDITIGKGYQIKMLVADILEILGPSVIPENTHLIINEGWGLTGYLRHPTGPIADMLSTIVEEIIIVKNGAGLIFWPQYNVNIIGNMNPGEAYKIKMESVETLTYPSNNYSSAKFAGTIPIPKYYSGIKNSDKDMTLCIPLDAWNIEPERGDEIGVFSQSGKLVGSGVFSNGNLALSIWGADNYSFDNNGLTDGEKFIVKLWDESENGEETLEIVSWTEGDDYYANNKIAIVEKINHSSPDSYLDQSIVLYQNIPNPFSGETEIRFYLPEENNLEICIFNVFGEHVETLATGKYGKGNHSIIFSSKNYASGNYYYKIITPDYVGTKSMNILKK
ncbi:MAG: T9SS type A sorting domain-containing protein [Bacteroidota bacterium]|nr:T9SS type A sorting domain-containing protein [Bacteroidota bacterium]